MMVFHLGYHPNIHHGYNHDNNWKYNGEIFGWTTRPLLWIGGHRRGHHILPLAVVLFCFLFFKRVFSCGAVLTVDC